MQAWRRLRIANKSETSLACFETEKLWLKGNDELNRRERKVAIARDWLLTFVPIRGDDSRDVLFPITDNIQQIHHCLKN